MSAPIAGRMYLKALFDGHEGKFINLRAIPADRDEHHTIEEFHPTGDIEAVLDRCEQLMGTHDVYVGVAARDRESGGKDAISASRFLWADCDSQESSEELAGFEPKPTMLVASGSAGHFHAYWLLESEISAEQAESLNHRLALRLKADVACRDASRILRVPGTNNHKYGSPGKVRIKDLNETRHPARVFDEILPPLPETAAKSKRKSKGKAISKDGPSDPVRRVLDQVEDVRTLGSGWMATCPAHDDGTPSLSIGEGDDGRCLIHCFAGCEIDAVLDALGLDSSDIFSDTSDGGRVPLAVRIVEMALAQEVELFHTVEDESWISVNRDGIRECWKVSSSLTKSWLTELHYRANAGVISRDVMNEVQGLLAAKAIFDGPEREVGIRVAGRVEGPVYVDIGDPDRHVVKIDHSGFEVAQGSALYFHRDPASLALAIPDPDGSIEDLRPFVNVRDDESWMRLIGFLLMCFHPSGPYPVLNIIGEQGSAKSTLSKLVLDLVDPHKAGALDGTPRVQDLAITASRNRLIVLDNVSSVKRNLSDTLCRMSTGGGIRKRRLYTDDEEVVLEYRRPVVINGINQSITAPDLLERSAPVQLLAITDEARRTETEFWDAWADNRASVLGGLLNAASASIRNVDQTEVPGMPRLADWALWVEAAAEALGWRPGAFIQAIGAGQEELVENSIDDHVEIRGLIDLIEEVGELRLTATELLDKIHDHLDLDRAGRRDLIQRGAELSRALKEFTPALRRRGIEVEFGREGGGTRDRYILVRKVG